MKHMDELDKLTFWDISVNEGALTQLVLGFMLIFLGIADAFIDIYYKVKYKIIYWRS